MANEMTLEQQVAELQAENARLQGKLKAQGQSKLALKIGEKGGLSVYGLGRFPVTLYASQWRRLLSEGPTIEGFLTDHAGELSEKA